MIAMKAQPLLVCIFYLFSACRGQFSISTTDEEIIEFDESVILNQTLANVSVWTNLVNNTVELFDESVDFRQDVCGRYEEVVNGTRTLKDSLEGMELRPIIYLSRKANILGEVINFEDDANFADLQAKLLDKLCEKAKCTWRSSFAAMVFIQNLYSNKTYDDLIKWSSNSFDLSATFWLPSSKRIGEGVSFVEPWFNADIIMVRKREEPNKRWINFSFLDPFSLDVWLSVSATCILSGLVYWILSILNPIYDKSNPVQAIYQATMTFTSNFEFHAVTHPMRLFTVSLSFWALVISNSYVANLTNFLVKKDLPNVIRTVDDVFQRGERICTLRFSQSENEIKGRFNAVSENSLILSKDSFEDLYAGVRSGECLVAITLKDAWRLQSNMTIYNPNCELEVTGRTFKQKKGGFAVAFDSGVKCTALVNNVLSYWMLEMKETGEFDSLWDNYFLNRSETGKRDCSVIKDNSDSTIKLTMENLGGIFFIHAVIVIVSLFLALWFKYVRGRRKKKGERDITRLVEKNNHDEDSSNGISNDDGALKEVKNDIKSLDKKIDAKLSKLIDLLVEQDSLQYSA